MINPLKKSIIYLCRKGLTVEKISKINKYCLFVYLFLLLTLGLNWKFNFSNPTIKLSVSMNLVIWWILIFLQNSTSLFLFLFRTKIPKYRDQYLKSLFDEKYVVVGYKDTKFKLGTKYKVSEDINKNMCGYYSQPQENIFTGSYAGFERISIEQTFKFISNQKNRKMKLQKLKNFN